MPSDPHDPHGDRRPTEELRLFLSHFHGLALGDVQIRGVVPGEPSDGYARLVQDAMTRAWRERGHRPLPPGYDENR